MDSCRSVFVIDDYPINLQIAEIFLRKQAFFDKIHSYMEAEKALAHIESHRNNAEILPDVILLDIEMPIMDGWRFLDRFEDVLPHLQKAAEVFVISSTIDYYERQRVKRYPSVKGVFPKPLDDNIIHDIAALYLASVG